MSEQKPKKKYTPDEALRHTMETLRSTNPSQAVLDVIEEIEREIDEREARRGKSTKSSNGNKTPILA
jgi:hypothetical protein